MRKQSRVIAQSNQSSAGRYLVLMRHAYRRATAQSFFMAYALASTVTTRHSLPKVEPEHSEAALCRLVDSGNEVELECIASRLGIKAELIRQILIAYEKEKESGR